MENKKSSYHWLILVSCCCVIIGGMGINLSTLGVFLTPIAKQLKIGIGPLTFFIAIYNFTVFLLSTTAGKFLQKYNIRVLMSIGGLGLALSMVAVSQVTALWQLYVAGVFIGIFGSFIFYLPVPMIMYNWFHKRTGFFLGIAMACSGFGSAVFNPLAGTFLTMYGWRTAYIIMAGFVALFILPFTLFAIRLRPSDKGLKAYGAVESAGGAAQGAAVSTGLTRAEAVKTPSFYFLILFVVAIGMFAGMQPNIPVYAGSLGLSPTLGGTVVSCVAISMVVGKIAIGYLNDKLGTVKAFFIFAVIGIAGVILLILGKAGGVTVILVGAFLFGLIMSLASIGPPLTVRSVFGAKEYGKIFALVMMGFNLSSVFAATIIGFIYDIAKSYVPALYFVIAMIIVAFLASWAAVAMGKKLNARAVKQ